MRATVDQVETEFFDRWAAAGGYKKNSDYDMQVYEREVSARKRARWQRAIIDTAVALDDATFPTARGRIHEAIRLIAEQRDDVPATIREAQPTSEDSTFRNLENAFYAVRRKRQLFSGIDPYGAHDIDKLAHAIIVGRFDIAAKIFMRADNKNKRRWIAELKPN